jgi:hypothetical protein
VTDYHSPVRIMESRFGRGLDDVIIIPFVLVTLAVSKILRFILLMLMRLLDYAFPLAIQIIWFPLFAARVLGNVTVSVKRRAALPSRVRGETSAVENIDPTEVVVAPTQDQLAGVRASCSCCI